jgi:hypothetical protein
MKGHYKKSGRHRGHYIVSTWLAGLALAILPGTGMSLSDHFNLGDPKMCEEASCSLTLIVAENAGSKKKFDMDINEYNPTVTYPGIYLTDQLFRKNLGNGDWVGSSFVPHLSNVTCSKAKAQLSEHGLWKGNLNRDGSCGSNAEPTDWAMGNLLNYQSTLNNNDEETETP